MNLVARTTRTARVSATSAGVLWIWREVVGDGVTMVWTSSDRRSDLPKDWRQRRLKVKERSGGQCEAVNDGVRCQQEGTECHHTGSRTDHRLEKLQWICSPCHKQRTTIDRIEKYSRNRPIEPHPGLRGGG